MNITPFTLALSVPVRNAFRCTILGFACLLGACTPMHGADTTAGSASARAVTAPASLEGATIKIHGHKTVKVKNNMFDSGERPIVYIPNGSTAQLQGDYICANGTGSRIWEMYLSGTLPQPEEWGYEYESTTPATITFTAKVGKVYVGVLNGYLLCSRNDYGDDNVQLVNTPVTITLP